MKRFKKELVDAVAHEFKIAEYSNQSLQDRVATLLKRLDNAGYISESAYQPEPRDFWICPNCDCVVGDNPNELPESGSCRCDADNSVFIRVREVVQ